MIEVRGNLVYMVEPDVEQLVDNVLHVELSVDRSPITANGTDTATVSARVFDYQGVQQLAQRTIRFIVHDQNVDVQTTLGVATIEVTAETVGSLYVTTDVDYVRNAEVTIVAR